MQSPVTSRHLLGATELVLVADIRPEFVPIADVRTYASRLRLVLETLFQLRQVAIERDGRYDSAGPLESLRMLHTIHWSLLERDTKLLLAVSFDGPWEPYIRAIVERAGPLLDLIFCHCTGYEGHSCHEGYAGFSSWVRERQRDTPFFYAASPDVTVDDARYLRALDRQGMLTPPDTLTASDVRTLQALKERVGGKTPATLTTNDAQQLGALEAKLDQHMSRARAAAALNVAAFSGSRPTGDAVTVLQSVFARLGALFPPGASPSETDDQNVFKRAVHALTSPPPAAPSAWPATPPTEIQNPATLQGNILTSYRDMTHGCLVLVRFDDREAGAKFFERVLPQITTEGATVDDRPRINVSITYQGLATLGVPAEMLAKLPKEFQEGMEQRAGMLGDVGLNHPENWSLPVSNGDGKESAQRVTLDTVDAIVTLEAKLDEVAGDHAWSDKHPLFSAVQELRKAGADVLHVQALRRYDQSRFQRGHFGIADGLSQPVAATPGAPAAPARDHVPLGELLLGYPNERGERGPDLPSELVANGSFLAVRKFAQDVDAFEAFVESKPGGLKRNDVIAKIVGRDADGTSPITGATVNDFDYKGDPNGEACPFFSHVRRTNPREVHAVHKFAGGNPTVGTTTTPRIVRRGFSYGPRHADDPKAARGLMFMSYQASLADQFEVIQRWVNGGNSTGVMSSHPDFLAGTPPPAPRTVACLVNGDVVHLTTPKKPLTRLEWGLYAFAPSTRGIQELIRIAREKPAPQTALADAGERLVNQLLALEARDPERGFFEWKRVLEDMERRAEALAIWHEVRRRGALRTEYGVLVGSAEGVRQVLSTPGVYSVREYFSRMQATFGGHYLGMDPTPQPFADDGYEQRVTEGQYDAESHAPNDFLMKIGFSESFKAARDMTLAVFARAATQGALMDVRQLGRLVVAQIAAQHFGMPDTMSGDGSEARDDKPPARCPVDFQRVSQFVFNPRPEPALERTAVARGKVVEAIARDFVSGTPTGALCPHLKKHGFEHDAMVRAWIGSINGFVVPTSGSFTIVMIQMLESRQLWRLQRWLLEPGVSSDDVRTRMRAGAMLPTDLDGNLIAGAVLRAMTLMPIPDLLHRTAIKEGTLPSADGNVRVEPGSHVVISLSSAAIDSGDYTLLFGGDRSAAKHPLHACPGRPMGLGVLLGMICGVLEQKNLRRKTKTAFSFEP